VGIVTCGLIFELMSLLYSKICW